LARAADGGALLAVAGWTNGYDNPSDGDEGLSEAVDPN
jgi:hypothetical protein